MRPTKLILCEAELNLYLIGLRGSGKSTVARELGKLLGRVVWDADAELERLAGTTITAIFAREGEAGFRKREQVLCGQLCGLTNVVVAWGGGVVLSRENRRHLRASGRTVWLQASPEFCWERVRQDPQTTQQRPALTSAAPADEFRTIAGIRAPIYAECADYSVSVETGTPREIADRIVAWWQQVDNQSVGE